MKKSKKRTRKNEGLAKSPLATLEIRSKGLTDSETGLMLSELDRERNWDFQLSHILLI